MDSAHRLQWRSLRDPEVYKEFPQLSPAACEKAIHVVTPRKKVFVGGAAFGEMAKAVPALRMFRAFYNIPGACPVIEELYAFIAKHRGQVDQLLGGSGTCRIDSRKKRR